MEIIPLPCPWFKLKENFLSRLRKGRNGSSVLLSHSINSTPSTGNSHNWAFFIREVIHGKIIMHLWYNLTSCVHFSSHTPHSHPHTLHILCSLCHSFFILAVLSHFSHVWLFVTPWTVAHQAPLSMGFWSTGVGCHALLQEIFPSQGLNSNVSCTGWKVLYH